jgi:hypothetical protein
VVKAPRSPAPFHRPKYFNHKIILASIELRSDAFARDKIALPKGQAGSALPFCTGEFSLRARTRRRELFREARIWRIDLRPRNTLGFKQLAGSGA